MSHETLCPDLFEDGVRVIPSVTLSDTVGMELVVVVERVNFELFHCVYISLHPAKIYFFLCIIDR